MQENNLTQTEEEILKCSTYCGLPCCSSDIEFIGEEFKDHDSYFSYQQLRENDEMLNDIQEIIDGDCDFKINHTYTKFNALADDHAFIVESVIDILISEVFNSENDTSPGSYSEKKITTFETHKENPNINQNDVRGIDKSCLIVSDEKLVNNFVANTLTDYDETKTYIKQEYMLHNESFKIPQEHDSSEDSDETSSSEEESSGSASDSESSSSEQEQNYPRNKAKKDNKKVEIRISQLLNGDKFLGDLPPIEDLHITVPAHECIQIGKVTTIVDDIVVINAFINTPALDLDSVLFLEKGNRAIGKVYEIIGPVKSPSYCVRFNSHEHIEKNNVVVDMDVYCAPKTKYTSFIFVEQLRKMKWSDQALQDEENPDPEEIFYSDDEEERMAKSAQKNNSLTEDDCMAADRKDGSCNRKNRHRNRNSFSKDEPKKMLQSFRKGGRIYRPAKPAKESQNPFYRSSKNYNRRQSGPIKWNSISCSESFNRGRTNEISLIRNKADSLNTSNVHIDDSGNLLNCQNANAITIPLSMADFSRPPPPLPPTFSKPTPRISYLEHPTESSNYNPANHCWEVANQQMNKGMKNIPEKTQFGQVIFHNNLNSITHDASLYYRAQPTYQNPTSNNYSYNPYAFPGYGQKVPIPPIGLIRPSSIHQTPNFILQSKVPQEASCSSTAQYNNKYSQSANLQPPMYQHPTQSQLSQSQVPTTVASRNQCQSAQTSVPPKILTWLPGPQSSIFHGSIFEDSTLCNDSITPPGT